MTRLILAHVWMVAAIVLWNSVAPTHAQGPAGPDLWAVVVGIDGYTDPAIPGCKGAVADARAVRRWLVEDAGWDGNHVLLLVDGAPTRHGPATQQHSSVAPTRENLEWAIREWLPYRVKPADRVLVYCAGQATVLPGQNGQSPRPVLVPSDARVDRLDATSWSLDAALDPLAAASARPIVVWLDTSLQGRGKPVRTSAESPRTGSYWLEALTRWPGVSAWLAADGKPAVEDASAGNRGAFTIAVLKALGNREQPRNLLAALHELNGDTKLSAQGFRTLGGIPSGLSLWASQRGQPPGPAPELLLQQGHADRITELTVTPDGSRFISASMDSTIKIWRASDRVLTRTLAAHTIGVTALALAPDATKLASGDGAGRIWVWNLPELRPRTFAGPRPHTAGIVRIEFLPDGRRFVSLDFDGKAVLWDAQAADGLNPKALATGSSAIAVGGDLIAARAAAPGNDAAIRLFATDGSALKTIPGPAGTVAVDNLLMDATRLAVATSSGKLLVWDITAAKPLVERELGTPILSLKLAPRTLAVALGDEIQLISLAAPFTVTHLRTGGRVARMTVATDGLRFAACRTDGTLLAWQLDDPAQPQSVAIGTKGGVATTVAFSPRGDRLLAGDQDGGIRAWQLPDPAAARIAPHRGKIGGLSVSSDGRFLLQISHDRTARVWDLREGRGLQPIDGEFAAGAFVPDGSALALATRKGDVTLIDRVNGRPQPAQFERPNLRANQPSHWGFGVVAVSPDGRLIAAGSLQGPLACVWGAGGGQPVRTIRQHDDAITALAFTADSRYLMTASLDGTAKVWDLSDRRAEITPTWTLRAVAGEQDINPIASASMSPKVPSRLVTGHRDGALLLWDLAADGHLAARRLGTFDGEVRAVAFTPDGQAIAAAGADKTVRLWTLAQPQRPPTRLEPQHLEQVNALVAWPDGKLLASASDDTTVRFWGLATPNLLGTLTASHDANQWVAFTPDGQFDSSPGGENQVTWLREDAVLPLEQFYDRYRTFGLCDLLRQGLRPPAVAASIGPPPPRLAIDPPTLASKGSEAILNVHGSDPDLVNFRLYHNDAPVKDDADFPNESGRERRVTVRLRPGPNRFYAMANRKTPGGSDGRSNVVEIALDEPSSPGRLHVLALGVSSYDRNPLRFADRDAEGVADYLSHHGVSPPQAIGRTIVLTNKGITPSAVQSALLSIRDVARPEDTVVVFVAGHTDVRRDRFCLLLPSFPFPDGQVLLANRGVLPAVSTVGGADDSATTLPYATIYRVLARISALQRMVIIDACQAEAIIDDPGVKRIQEKVDDGAHQARTAYLLAARRGEPATESAVLKHGVMTHVLLRGLGSTDLEHEPGPALPPNADGNGDGVVTTAELREYVARNLPDLAARVAETARRANSKPNPSANPAIPTSANRLQTTGDRPFPLVRLP